MINAKAIYFTFAGLAALQIAGCSGTIHKKSKLGSHNYLSIDARQRLITTSLVADQDLNKEVEVVCSEPSPHAFSARSSAASASGSAPRAGAGGATGTAAAAGGVASGESASALGARTQTIELIRDAYFRACEAYANRIIDKADYQSIVANVDSTMITLAAVDALGGATLAANNAISSPGLSVEIGKDADGNPVATKVSAGDAEAGKGVAAGKAGEKAADALRAIALYSLSTARTRTDRITVQKLAKLKGYSFERALEFIKLADELNHQGHADKFLLKTGGGIYQ